MPGRPLRKSVYRDGPRISSSRTISSVQRSPMTSRLLANPQNCPYERMARRIRPALDKIKQSLDFLKYGHEAASPADDPSLRKVG